ncbi:MAG: hypothetical protein ACOY81_00415 [Bacillota bacterium]|uniref:hypothetical protein n=1 Tax=Desulfurispora thermophila TaxID=265470 RepID=UPI000371BC1F|nr:hypothetical protein [Desulfurispora thermophila]
MFFRVVRTKYKDKQYKYLKLLESVRQGRRVMQRQVYNLGNVSHLSDEQLTNLVHDLEKVLYLVDHLTGYELSWGKFPRTSFLVALEYCLDPGPKNIDLQLFKRSLNTEKVKRMYFRQQATSFWSFLVEHLPHFVSENKVIIFTCHLPAALVAGKNLLLDIAFNSQGYPLDYKMAEGYIYQLKNFISHIDERFSNANKVIVSSERVYNNYVLPACQHDSEKGGQEILLHRQSVNWQGRLVGQSSRLYYLDMSGGLSAPADEAVSIVVDYLNFQDTLLASLPASGDSGGDGLSDMMDIYITSYFFKQCLQQNVDLSLLVQK